MSETNSNNETDEHKAAFDVLSNSEKILAHMLVEASLNAEYIDHLEMCKHG